MTFLNILAPPGACLSILTHPSDIALLNPIFEFPPKDNFCQTKTKEILVNTPE